MELRGDIVKELRLAKSWTQQHLADVCGVNLRTIQRIENKGSASLETIMALCVALEVQREKLFSVPSIEEVEGLPQGSNRSMALVLTFIVGLASGIGISLLAIYI